MSSDERQAEALAAIIQSGVRMEMMRLALEVFEIIKKTDGGDRVMTQGDFATLFLNAVRSLDN